jgi:8-oxo-dGTP pyrophosphatase MutT (NUDIX family)
MNVRPVNLPAPGGVGPFVKRHRPSFPDPRLLSLRGGLIPADEEPDPAPTVSGDRIHAAVSLVLRSRSDLEILLIRRAEADGDPWSGHMALPGGRQDPADRDLLHTAMRETLEETGVHLAEEGVLLGRLAPLVPGIHRLPPISILPFVFGVPAGTDAMPASTEVVQVFWAPLSVLRGPDASGTVDIPMEDGPRTFPCFRVEGHVVWGLTYRILSELERRI